jgi:hypothetical protein
MSIDMPSGVNLCVVNMTPHLVSLGPDVTSTNTGQRGSSEMKTKAKLFCSCLLLSLIIMLPGTVRAELAVPLYDKTKKLFEQLQDLELMQRNIEKCYQAEKRTPMVACRSGQSWREHAELDGKLMNRVFDHLAGVPEYERFIMQYRTLIQRPDYRRLHTDELFAEYMRLLESGRIRFLTQLKECQESLAEKWSAQAHEGLAESIPVKTVTFGHAGGSQRTESGRVAPGMRLQLQMPLSGSTRMAVGQKSVSRIVVHGMDQSGSAGTAAPTIDMVELNILVTQERIVPLEEVLMGYRRGLVKGVRSRTRTNLNFSDAVGRRQGMGSMAKKFVIRSLMLALFLSPGYLTVPMSPAVQGSPETVILEQKVKEATRVLQQRPREAARAQELVKRRQPLAGEFGILVVKAKGQHAMIEKWQKAHSSEFKIKARRGVDTKRFH